MKNLVLIGGGHSHAIALRNFASNPVPNVRLILISESIETPYSGMLPGHIAGFYTHQQCHINLQRLAHLAQAEFCIDRVINLDLQKNQVICTNHPAIDFDILSINIGSTPEINVPGASEYVIPAKPWSKLLAEWHKFCNDEHYNRPIRIAVVGGGAAGVELTLAIQARLEKETLEMHLFHRDIELMPSHHSSVQKLMKRVLLQRGIRLHLGKTVSKVEKVEKIDSHLNIVCECGLEVECDKIFWVTQASAPQWLKTTGLATDEKGFILVKNTLQSISHPHIFATGDIGTMVNYPRPKAGVFAVRQGKPLFDNLRRIVLGELLQEYTPQSQYLSLIGMGNGSAIANRGALTLPPSRLLWFWKDWIDKRFMNLILT